MTKEVTDPFEKYDKKLIKIIEDDSKMEYGKISQAIVLEECLLLRWP